jgi:hypothetical protein
MSSQNRHELSVYSETGIDQCQNIKALYRKINQAEAVLLSQTNHAPQFTLVELPVNPVD